MDVADHTLKQILAFALFLLYIEKNSGAGQKSAEAALQNFSKAAPKITYSKN